MSAALVAAAAIPGLVTPAAAQAPVVVEGRAFGSEVFTQGESQEGLMTSDTGEQSATAPGSFEETADGDSRSVPLVATVMASGASTQGVAATDPPSDSFVESMAGSVALQIFPGAAAGSAAAEFITSGSFARINCEEITGSSGIELVAIGGNAIPVPGSPPPNTTVTVPGVAEIVMNEQRLETNLSNREVRLTVRGIHAFLPPDGSGIEAILSHSFAAETNVPPECVFPDIGNAMKRAELVTDADGDGFPDVGDRIRYTITGENVGGVPLDVDVIDRLPREVTYVAGSATVNGAAAFPQPVPQPCPERLEFTGCPGEAAIDTTRQCVTVELGTLAPGDAFLVTIDVVVAQRARRTICNQARILDEEVVSILFGGRLVTGGGGGCRIGAAAAPGDLWPVAAILSLLALRRFRPRPASRAR